MHWCQGRQQLHKNEENSVLTPRGDVPFVLHQYNRHQGAIDHLVKQCGMISFPKV